MKILVTGGAGFIGSHVAEAYLALGHNVWIVDDMSSGKKENIPAGAVFCPWDIADARVEKLLAQEKIELINHHAAQIDIRVSVSNPVADAKVNILGLIHLLEAGRKAAVRRFIFASTGGAIYGEQESFPAAEDHPAQPFSPYGVAKYAGEQYLAYYHKAFGIVPQILRYANVYGPRQNPHGEAGVIAIFTAKMFKGESPVIHGNGLQTRDFVCVPDVVNANVLALQKPQSCLFNVGTGQESNIKSLAENLKRLTAFAGPIVHDAPKEGEQLRSCIDSSRIAKAWGWKPRVELSEGLQRTVEWFGKMPVR